MYIIASLKRESEFSTEAGLKSFKSSSINKIFEQGLNAAIKRSKEISNEY